MSCVQYKVRKKQGCILVSIYKENPHEHLSIQYLIIYVIGHNKITGNPIEYLSLQI